MDIKDLKIFFTSLLVLAVLPKAMANEGGLCAHHLIGDYMPAIEGTSRMTEDRHLFQYAQDFDPSFAERLVDLRLGQVWLDVGAGALYAQMNYLLDAKFAAFDIYADKSRELNLPPADQRVLPKAIAVKLPRLGFPEKAQKLLDEKKIDYQISSLSDYAKAHPNSVDLLTDKKASAIYSHFRFAVLDMLRVLKVGGTADIDVQYIAMYDKDGKRSSVYEYLSKGSGFEIISKRDWTHFFVSIRKTSDEFTLPELEITKSQLMGDGPNTHYRYQD